MRRFAETWPDEEIVQQVVAQIQWRSIITCSDDCLKGTAEKPALPDSKPLAGTRLYFHYGVGRAYDRKPFVCVAERDRDREAGARSAVR
jgi:hypothetical protein